MPTLSTGERARLYALGGVGRGGACRAGAIPPHLTFAVKMSGEWVEVGAGKAIDEFKVRNLTVVENEGGTPNTATFEVQGFTPYAGQEVRARLGSINNPVYTFAGTVLNFSQTYRGSYLNPVFSVNAIDYTWGLNKRKISGYFTGTITAIAESLIGLAPSGYTMLVEQGLSTLTGGITCTNQDLTEALGNLAKRVGGYWYCDYNKVVHFFVTQDTTAKAPTAPTTIGPSNTLLLKDQPFTVRKDISQVETRVYVEGRGSRALTAVAAGETIVPVEDAAAFSSTGGTFVSGPQRVTYTSMLPGGGGSIVGPGAAPSSAMAVVAASGTGIENGVHNYAVTFVTGAGESLPSPLASFTAGLITAGAAPTANAPSGGTGPDPGVHRYAVTFVTSSGETTPSAVSNDVTTTIVSAPAVAPVIEQVPGVTYGREWSIGDSVYVCVSRVTAGGETTVSPDSNTVTVPNNGVGKAGLLRLSGFGFLTTDPAVVSYRVYVNVNGSWLGGLSYSGGALWFDAHALTGSRPASNTATACVVPLSDIPLGGPLVTARKIYGTAAGGSQLKLVGTIPNNTATTYNVTTVDASLGADAPSSNTATANQAALSGIPIGGSGTTGRKVYRTTAGGSQLKLQQTIADNSTTTASDSTADASLGTNAPSSDTSGLTLPAGQVLAGATSILVAGTGNFSGAGGWAIIGNGSQVVRYTGITSSSLTGIPASGPGSITATVPYNSTITAAPALYYVPASGAGSIQYAINSGDDVNIWIQRDDTAAQATLAALIGGDGIQEGYIQDRRLSQAECESRGDARLALRSQMMQQLTYKTHDKNTRAGRDAFVNMTSPLVYGYFKVQRVTISNFQPSLLPYRAVEASTERFTFEQLLAQKRGLE